MRFKDMFGIIDHSRLWIVDSNYNELACLDTGCGDFKSYHSECEKARAIAEADEYIVKKVQLLDGDSRSHALIVVELEKEPA